MNKNIYIKTSLYEEHKKLGAKIIPFAGYLMPVSYKSGIIYEYKSVRENIGVFDVSHMGQIKIMGNGADKLLDYLTTNNISNISNNSAQYNAFCNNNGGTIDDVIVYKINTRSFFIIVNASNIEKVYNWLIEKNTYNIKIENISDKKSLLALQGQNSRNTILKLFNINLSNLKFYTFIKVELFEHNVIISRTGYTGELGYEFIGNHKIIKKIWKVLMSKNIQPCGLAVRDILRLEMKYCLYGNDLLENISPIHAGLKWIVDFNKENFVGKKNLQIEFNNPSMRLLCFKMIDRAIPRNGYEVFIDDEKAGFVSSGTFSLGLKKGIGLAFIDSKFINNNFIDIEIRKKIYKAEIIKPPFINKYSLHS